MPFLRESVFPDGFHPPPHFLVKTQLPLAEVLRHESVGAFITSGDSNALDLAVLTQKPMVVIPLLGEQISNGQLIDEKRIGVVLQPDTLIAEQIVLALQEVISKSTYVQNLKDYRSNNTSGVKIAVNVIENVLANRNGFKTERQFEGARWQSFVMWSVYAFQKILFNIDQYVMRLQSFGFRLVDIFLGLVL